MANTPRLGIRLLEATDVANFELINTILQLIDSLVAKQEALAAATGHTHNGTDGNGPKIPYANVTGGPASLPAAGGDSDTVDGKHASDFPLVEHSHSGAAGQGPKIPYANLTGAPASLPANGGNADTVDNLHAADLAGIGHTHSGAAGQGSKIPYDNLTGTPTALPASGGDSDTVDGKHASDFATAGHAHSAATQALAGFLSATDKAALDTLVSRVDQALKSTSSPTFNVVTANRVIGAVYA